jgi:hypothetical protein
MKNSKFKPFPSSSIADMPTTGELCFVAACCSINGHSAITNSDSLTSCITVAIAKSRINMMFLQKSSTC